jgi:two-component system response regulator YesN
LQTRRPRAGTVLARTVEAAGTLLRNGECAVPYHLLLVDDDADFSSEFAETLIDDYRVTLASGGSEAIKILEKPNDVDLVILDVMMPDVKGTVVLRKIKQMAPDLAVIILTGFSSKDVAIEALKGAADDYVEKPVQVVKIREAIARLLQKTRARGDIVTGGIDGKIERVKHFLEVNCHKSVKLEDAAMAVGLSPKYLSRVFQERTGNGFNDYKFKAKMDKAKELLSTTGSSVNQISYALGYENPESFIRMFKRITGKTPAAYRRTKGRRKA